MKAIILARVSTEEQKEAGNSLPAQIARLETYCRQKGLQIIKTYSFDESAYKTKRDDFDKIVDYLNPSKEKIAVCFDKVDRFSRNIFDKRVAYLYELTMKDQIELHFSSDNLVITPNISAVEKFHFGINLGLAKYYSDAISDSVKRVNEQKIRRGELTGRPPIGYKSVYDSNNKRVDVVPDPDKNHFIEKIFDMYSTGNHSIKMIQQEMKKLGLKSIAKIPKPLSTSQIYAILKNPIYYGMRFIKNELHPHKYEPLISKYLFDKCQSVMAGYHKKPFKYAGKPFTLRGMIKCADCGCTITPEEQKGHIYYSCTNYKKMHAKRLYIEEKDLLKPIYNVLNGIQLPDKRILDITEDLKKLHESKNKFHEQAVSELNIKYEKIENKIKHLFDLRLEDEQSITKDMFTSKLKELKEEQTEIIEKLAQHNKADEKFYLTANMVLNLAKRALEVFESSEPAEKRQLLNFLLQNLQLQGKKLLFTLKTPFDTVLKATQYNSRLRHLDSNQEPTP